jgi:hypothetical protein
MVSYVFGNYGQKHIVASWQRYEVRFQSIIVVLWYLTSYLSIRGRDTTDIRSQVAEMWLE